LTSPWFYFGTDSIRNSWTALTFKLDLDFLSKLWEIFISEAETVSHVPNVVPGMTLQPLNREEISLFNKNGGNCLGIEENDWPLVGIYSPLLVSTYWLERLANGSSSPHSQLSMDKPRGR
jgi:hypothetical protein